MSQTIEYELRCSQCGYNLYLGKFGGSCAECGAMNLLSALDAVERADQRMAMTFRYEAIAGLLNRVEAIKFVWHAFLFASEATHVPGTGPIKPGSVDISPGIWCKTPRDDAVLQWGGEAATTLASLGISRSEHVGVIAAGLERVGWLAQSTENDAHGFIGCCEYHDLPASLV